MLDNSIAQIFEVNTYNLPTKSCITAWLTYKYTKFYGSAMGKTYYFAWKYNFNMLIYNKLRRLQDACNARRTPIPIIHIQRFPTCEMLQGAESHAPQSGSRRMRRTLLAKWRGDCVREFCEGVVESPTRWLILSLFRAKCFFTQEEATINVLGWESYYLVFQRGFGYTEKSYSRNVYRGLICWFEGAFFG